MPGPEPGTLTWNVGVSRGDLTTVSNTYPKFHYFKLFLILKLIKAETAGEKNTHTKSRLKLSRTSRFSINKIVPFSPTDTSAGIGF